MSLALTSDVLRVTTYEKTRTYAKLLTHVYHMVYASKFMVIICEKREMNLRLVSCTSSVVTSKDVHVNKIDDISRKLIMLEVLNVHVGSYQGFLVHKI